MSRTSIERVILVAAAVTVLGVAYHFGVLGWVRDPLRLKQALLDLGSLGFLAYLLAYALLQPFGVPGTAFVLAAALIWPPAVAIPLSLAGTTLATIVGFSFARFIARDWVEKRIPERLRGYDERLETRGFATVFGLRFVLWMNPWLHALFGISRVPFSTHLAASILAYIAPVVGITLLGDTLFAVMRRQSLQVWAAAALGLGAVGIASWLWRRRSPRTGTTARR